MLLCYLLFICVCNFGWMFCLLVLEADCLCFCLIVLFCCCFVFGLLVLWVVCWGSVWVLRCGLWCFISVVGFVCLVDLLFFACLLAFDWF